MLLIEFQSLVYWIWGLKYTKTPLPNAAAKVSILGLLDLGFKGSAWERIFQWDLVSILGLLDLGFKEKWAISSWPKNMCFNPWFIGFGV